MPKRGANGCPVTHVRDDFIQQLLEGNSIRKIRRSEVRGYVKFFTIPEHGKQRFRPIRHTYEINEVFGKETLIGTSFPTKKTICNMVLQGTHFAAFDMAAYYDQFGLENGVGNYLCCRKNGEFYAANLLAMGQRQGCDIGQTTTQFLMDFEDRQCVVAHSVIDNSAFVGSYEQVLHDAKIFVQRCRDAGVTLNEFAQIEEKGIESLILQKGEWCGVALDFVEKTVKVTEKTLQKIEISWNNRANWTVRQFSAHIGLLFWTWGILDIPIHEFYPLLRFISETSRRMQQDETLWDTPININNFKSSLAPLEAWTTLARNNSPHRLKQSTDSKWFICTDASAHGWGYVAFNQETGEIRFHGAQWTQRQLSKIFSRNGVHKIKKSVYSEPLAIYFSLCHFLKNGDEVKIEFAEKFKDDLRMKIKIATDNSSAQHTMNRGFASRSFDINEAIKNLRNQFLPSQFDFEFCYVPGWLNPADPFSRKLFFNNNNNNNKVNANIGHKTIDKLRQDMGNVCGSTGCGLRDPTGASTRHADSTGGKISSPK